MRTLLERDWIRVVGHRDVPGRPEMFGTTRNFLDYFGLRKLDDLPPLADLSNWESLRVQLNLPEVDEEVTAVSEGTVDVPVLYPERDDVVENAGEAGPEEVAQPEQALPENADVEEPFVVSEWPDPNKPVVAASLNIGDTDDDKDVSANG